VRPTVRPQWAPCHDRSPRSSNRSRDRRLFRPEIKDGGDMCRPPRRRGTKPDGAPRPSARESEIRPLLSGVGRVWLLGPRQSGTFPEDAVHGRVCRSNSLHLMIRMGTVAAVLGARSVAP
jgi:hypothetical protein